MRVRESITLLALLTLLSTGVFATYTEDICAQKEREIVKGDLEGPDYIQPPKHYKTIEWILAEAGLKKAPKGPPPVPVTGTREILVILAELTDVTPDLSHDTAHYWDRFFDTAAPSVRDYFDEVSYGNFTYVPGYVRGWYPSTYSTTDYHASSANRYAIFAEAIQNADNFFDFAPYDTDSNGVVENEELTIFVIVTHTVGCTACTATHSWNRPQVVTNDGVSVEGEYSITHEWRHIGSYCHELGHDLGLPDLYDTDGGSEGIGEYGLMGGGSYTFSHMTAWSKIQLGWITPTVVTVTGYYDVHDAETNAEAYILVDPSHSTDEYFLVENRYPANSYYETVGPPVAPGGTYPDTGIVIYHIDESRVQDWINFGTNNVNIDETHKGVDVETAEHPSSHFINADDMDAEVNRGDTDDLWDINEYDFDDTSTPCNANWYDGTPSGMDVRDFPAVNATMRVHLSVPAALTPLSSSISATPSTVSSGQQVAVTMTVTNTGGTAINNVTPSALIVNALGTASVVLLSGPTPASANIPASNSQNFTWTYLANSGANGGTISFAGNATGTDTGTGNPVSSQITTSNIVIVQVPASINANLTTNIATIVQGQNITVILIVSNTGQATANNVTPSPLTVNTTGIASVTYVSGPTPGLANIPGGSSEIFTWIYTCNSGNIGDTITFSGNATGTDANSGNPLTSNTSSVTVTVQIPVNTASSELPHIVNQQLRPLSNYRINQAEELMSVVQELIDRVKAEEKDVIECENLLKQAKDALEKAYMYFDGANYIAANNWAIKAIELLTKSKECLENL